MYIKLVIFGKKPATDFADANYDGKVSMLDIGQTKLIILGKEKELTLVDHADRTVTLCRPVERVAIASLDGLRIPSQLGAADRLVGMSKRYITGAYDSGYVLLPVEAHPELKELPDIGSYTDPNLEVLLSLNPDVYFMYGGATGQKYADKIYESTLIPPLGLGGNVYKRIKIISDSGFDEYRLVGKVLGKEEEAEELISFMEEEIAKVTEVTSEIPDDEKPKVYLMFWPSGGRVTRTVANYEPLDIAGGINVAKGWTSAPYSVDVSKEQIIKWNPDIILVHSHFFHQISIEDVVFSDPVLQTTNAVKNRTVYYTKGHSCGWDPAMGIVEAIYMAKLLHPDKFKDWDMEKEGNEVLERFYGADGLYTKIRDSYDLYRWD
jgi:iron complex transport system substrate-binding protein